jgi:hypothetical protein
MYASLHQIRALPGLNRFMLGETYETILTVAVDHPAVVLVGARDYFYALIISAGQLCGNTPLKLNLKETDLEDMSVYKQQSLHRGASPPELLNSMNDRSMRFQRKSPQDHFLQVLWLKIVKPVLDVLQLQVRVLRANNTLQLTQMLGIASGHSSTSVLVPHRCFHIDAASCSWHL